MGDLLPDAKIHQRTGPLSRRAFFGAAASAGLLLPALSGCGPDSGTTLRVSYKQWGTGKVIENFLTTISEQFRQTNPDITVQLVPLVAGENDYFTKNELMMSSASTTADLVYEDTFILKSDVAAGYLRPINTKVQEWDAWPEFYDSAKSAVTGEDGNVYAVPIGTDTRALWYNSELLAAAGLPIPWQPTTWAELLRDLEVLRKALPEVTPFNIFSSKAQGEATAMQGFEMLLYGTQDSLYDAELKKWVTGSRGFIDSLEFIRAVSQKGLGPSMSYALNPNLADTIYNDWLPNGKLAVNLDGGWLGLYWAKGAAAEWPEWDSVLKQARMPTQFGDPPGYTTMSGGWSWAFPARSKKFDLAWEFLKIAMTKENAAAYNIADNGIAVRKDVAQGEAYRGSGPAVGFFTSLVEGATFRPALAAYPQISASLQGAAEKVLTGSASPEQAAQAYDEQITGIVGADNVTAAEVTGARQQ